MAETLQGAAFSAAEASIGVSRETLWRKGDADHVKLGRNGWWSTASSCGVRVWRRLAPRERLPVGWRAQRAQAELAVQR